MILSVCCLYILILDPAIQNQSVTGALAFTGVGFPKSLFYLAVDFDFDFEFDFHVDYDFDFACFDFDFDLDINFVFDL